MYICAASVSGAVSVGTGAAAGVHVIGGGAGVSTVTAGVDNGAVVVVVIIFDGGAIIDVIKFSLQILIMLSQVFIWFFNFVIVSCHLILLCNFAGNIDGISQ
ncbi:Hypothetical predicted protein [Octopus vulgaris]|uniref:Uncharacterized protein n=1 Tax=Octopus vulgaris TaxID=6645 RepID=A0AA36F6X4_OCTVU|nr:Hypothetical predicted protein [Octopus vulgaris]